MTETLTQQSSESKTPRPKRRWLQFNLRTLLVLTLVVGLGLGWVMYERRKNAKLKADIDALESLGCSFAVEILRPSFFDWLLNRDISGVFSVKCSSSSMTDAGLVHLKGLTQIQSLNLSHTAITDSGLDNLKGLTHFLVLFLDRTEVTDSGLENLMGLTSLEYLNLSHTAITDSGLEHLKRLARLSQLHLEGTKVTKSGVAELQKALPNCTILHDAKD